MLLEKDEKKDVTAILNKHYRSVTGPLNLFSWLEDTPMSSRNYRINFIIKKFAFYQSIKAIKKKIKSKSEFSLNHVSTETIKKIINEYV